MFFSRVNFSLFRRSAVSRFKVAVGVKQVVDYSVRVRVGKNGNIQTENVKLSANPFDEIALEEAVCLKEKGIAKEVIAISIGPSTSIDVLRSALAMGFDKAIHVVTKDKDQESLLDSLAVANIFSTLQQELQADLWLLGKQAVDDDCGCTPQLLSGLMGVPLASFASKIIVDEGDHKKVTVAREVDTGCQTVEITTPCVISVDLRLNTPRFLKLSNIMKARKKPVDVRPFSSFNIGSSPLLTLTHAEEPVVQKACIRVKTVDELVGKLKEAKIL